MTRTCILVLTLSVVALSTFVPSVAVARHRRGILRRVHACQPSCQPARVATTYYPRDPNGCPPNTAEADAQELFRRVDTYTYRVSVYNNSDFTVICKMKYTRFQDGVVVDDYCVAGRVEVPPRSEVFYGETTLDPNARYLTQEFLDVWNVVIKR